MFKFYVCYCLLSFVSPVFQVGLSLKLAMDFEFGENIYLPEFPPFRHAAR